MAKRGFDRVLGDTLDVIRKGVDQVKPYTDPYTKPVEKAIERGIGEAGYFLDEKGVTKKVQEIGGTVSEHFDVVSGKKILDEVQKRLAKQDAYNDALATKLFEALERIKVLESRLGISK